MCATAKERARSTLISTSVISVAKPACVSGTSLKMRMDSMLPGMWQDVVQQKKIGAACSSRPAKNPVA